MNDDIPSPYGAFEMPNNTLSENIPPQPRPFVVAADLSHYVVRETATGKSITKRCAFDEADYACNLLNYGWRACARSMRDAASKAGDESDDCCSNCGRCCCNRLCERCKLAERGE